MPSSRAGSALLALVAFATTAALAPSASAQRTAQGFAVDRFYPSPAGAGWFVMDTLDMHGGFGGAMAFTTGYASNDLTVKDGARALEIVSDRAVADFAFAATYDRFRLSLGLEAPIVVSGQSGTADGYTFAAPSVSLASTPDAFADTRVGLDARLIGGPSSPFRLGASAQVFIPTGKRVDYDSDGTWRGMFRLLAAGNAGAFTYAAHLGIHLRPLDDAAVPGSPRGSEVVFGIAAGPRFLLGRAKGSALVVGPEVYGASAFDGFGGATATEVEGLLTARLEGTHAGGMNVRVKVGGGTGLDRSFGAPDVRLLLGIEISGGAARPDEEPR